MKEYFEFCPISKAAEVRTERWAPLVIRELLLGATHFNEIQRGIAAIPNASLSQRLKMLEEKGVVTRGLDGDGRPHYQLTSAGIALEIVIKTMGAWGHRWLEQAIREEDLNLHLLMWDIHRRINLESLPVGRTVVQFDFSGARTGRFWLLLARPKPEVCDYDPGIPVDLFVAADAMTMTGVWMGRLWIEAAHESGKIELTGPTPLVVQFPSWLALNYFAPIAHASA
jgi:DNA-binding HxlR family transcriptional regulator